MDTKINIGVYRRLDNRFEGLSDQSIRALELHNKRKKALHDIFDTAENIEVTDWGKTNDESPHEWVELFVTGMGSAVFKYAVVPGIKFIAEKLIENAIDRTTSELVKWVISKFRPKQKSKEILDFEIKMQDGTFIRVDPPDRNATITIQFSNGRVESIKYDTTESNN